MPMGALLRSRRGWALAAATLALVGGLAAQASAAPAVRPGEASGPRDVDQHEVGARAERRVPVCSAPPQRVVRGDSRTFVVRCAGAVRIELVGQRGPGSARLRRVGPGAVRVTFTAPDATALTRLRVRARGAFGSRTLVQVVRTTNPMIRAIGDSVTSAFAYIGFLGRPMLITEAQACFTTTTPPDNRCSSNSGNGPSGGNRVYLRDFGFANQVAYSARYAKSVGSRPRGLFQNLAIQGSTPVQWAKGGVLNATTRRVVEARPDIIVMTLGANPSLSYFLAGEGTQCASAPDFVRCARQGIDQFAPGRGLRKVILELLEARDASIIVSTYYDLFPIPAIKTYTPDQIRTLVAMLEERIRGAARTVPGFGRRVFLMEPPEFEVGLPPGESTCTISVLPVDGPSNQSRASQADLLARHPGRFCLGEAWITSQDTGIHPNRRGQQEFEKALAGVIAENGLLPAAVLADRSPTPDPPPEPN